MRRKNVLVVLLAWGVLAACSSAGGSGSGSQTGGDAGVGVEPSGEDSGESGMASAEGGTGSTVTGADAAGSTTGGLVNGAGTAASNAGPGAANISGTLLGEGFAPTSVLAGLTSTYSGKSGEYGAFLLFTSFANACPEVTGGFQAKAARDRTFFIAVGGATPLAPGSIDLTPAAGNGIVEYETPTDGACGDGEEGVKGTLTITSVTDAEVAGSFDIELERVLTQGGYDKSNTDHIIGQFTAPLCGAFSANISKDNTVDPNADAGPVCP